MSAAVAEVAVYEGTTGSSKSLRTCSGDETDSTVASSDKEASEAASGYAEVDTKGCSGYAHSPTIEDALDAQGVADELLEDWTRHELQALVSDASGAEARLPLHVRHTAISVLSSMAQHAGLQQKSLAEASLLLDVFILKSVASTKNPDSIVLAINTLPATCVALVAILGKFDCVLARTAITSFSIARACSFAQNLQQMGYTEVNAAVTENMINTQEAKVLQKLRWRIHMPNTESWTSTFSSRFNVLTRNLIAPSLTWVWQHGMFAARMIMMHQASSEALPPKQLAAGLLAIGLVGARLLPLEAVRPHQMTDEDWIHLYHATGPQELHPKCMFPTKCSQRLVKLLTIAVGVDLAKIQEFACLAAFAMKDAQELARKLAAGEGARTTSSDGSGYLSSASDLIIAADLSDSQTSNASPEKVIDVIPHLAWKLEAGEGARTTFSAETQWCGWGEEVEVKVEG